MKKVCKTCWKGPQLQSSPVIHSKFVNVCCCFCIVKWTIGLAYHLCMCVAAVPGLFHNIVLSTCSQPECVTPHQPYLIHKSRLCCHHPAVITHCAGQHCKLPDSTDNIRSRGASTWVGCSDNSTTRTQEVHCTVTGANISVATATGCWLQRHSCHISFIICQSPVYHVCIHPVVCVYS